ncbi:MAG TPA: hypothetical protein VIY98_07295, partial [Nitrososphaeraceae archaeon]
MIKKKEIRIIKSDSNKEDYTFVSSNNILNNTKNNESINKEISLQPNYMIELKKRFTQRK